MSDDDVTAETDSHPLRKLLDKKNAENTAQFREGQQRSQAEEREYRRARDRARDDRDKARDDMEQQRSEQRRQIDLEKRQIDSERFELR